MTLKQFFESAPKGASFAADRTFDLQTPMGFYTVSLGNGETWAFTDDGGVDDVHAEGDLSDYVEGIAEELDLDLTEENEAKIENTEIAGYRSPSETKALLEELFSDFDEDDDGVYDFGEELEPYLMQAYLDIKEIAPEMISPKVKAFFESHDDDVKKMESSRLDGLKDEPVGTTYIGIKGPRYSNPQIRLIKAGEGKYLEIENGGYYLHEVGDDYIEFKPIYKNVYVKRQDTPDETIEMIEKAISEAQRPEHKARMEKNLEFIKKALGR